MKKNQISDDGAVLKADFACLTDKGKVRANNEDNVAIDAALGLAVVADGMGGHNAGELASSLAVGTMKETLADMARGEIPYMAIDPDLSQEANQLSYAASAANLQILSDKCPENQGMGTTLTAVLVRGRKGTIIHIGDSRIYLLRDQALTQLTNDHSLVAEHVRSGVLTELEARQSTLQNILTRALGINADIMLDVEELELKAGDKLLLCTDGINKVVSNEQIRQVMIAKAEPGDICKELVDMSLAAGAPDNVTVAVVNLY
ncbi:MAG: Stp1/IreP family PP2C-type Ser/Thr phosphatase [Elusimicrobiaceae bacterium]|nr:Stp1/IreP family PP2C-type Ser/Thr phosphatase [Elusimicrobiaceae bacterium]